MSAVEVFVCDYCGKELSEDNGWFYISEEAALGHTHDYDSESSIREDKELDFCCKQHMMNYIDENVSSVNEDRIILGSTPVTIVSEDNC